MEWSMHPQRTQILLCMRMEWEQCEWWRRHRKTQNHSLNSVLAYLFRSLVYLFTFSFFSLLLVVQIWTHTGTPIAGERERRGEEKIEMRRFDIGNLPFRGALTVLCTYLSQTFTTHNSQNRIDGMFIVSHLFLALLCWFNQNILTREVEARVRQSLCERKYSRSKCTCYNRNRKTPIRCLFAKIEEKKHFQAM